MCVYLVCARRQFLSFLKATQGRNDFFWLTTQGCSPSWWGSGGGRSWTQLVPYNHNQKTTKNAHRCSVLFLYTDRDPMCREWSHPVKMSHPTSNGVCNQDNPPQTWPDTCLQLTLDSVKLTDNTITGVPQAASTFLVRVSHWPGTFPVG